jgi:hypothetical protein
VDWVCAGWLSDGGVKLIVLRESMLAGEAEHVSVGVSDDGNGSCGRRCDDCIDGCLEVLNEVFRAWWAVDMNSGVIVR